MLKNIITSVKKNIVVSLLFCALLVLALYLYLDSGSSYNEPAIAFDGNSTELKKTVIVPTLSTPIPENKNVIWCSSFQYAWNTLKEDIIKEDILLKGNQIAAGNLNQSNASTADIADKSYYSAAGFGRDGIVKTIQQEMARRFPSVDKPDFGDITGESILAYCYLEAFVKFTTPYFENHKDFIFTDSAGNKTRTSSFCLSDQHGPAISKLREQIDILYIKQEQQDEHRHKLIEYAVDLCKHTEPYQIILAKIKPENTLLETFNKLQEHIDNFSKEEPLPGFGSGDRLFVPNIFWDITHHFKELEGKSLGNQKFTEYYISKAIQQTRFKLDRSGVELKSEAEIMANEAAVIGPKYFYFNQPFLVIIKKRTAKNPIFAMWVDNAELLAKPDPHKAKNK